MKWQPIETAPKDGSYILTAITRKSEPGVIVKMSYWRKNKTLEDGGHFTQWGYFSPHYWMPLPVAPQEDGNVQ